MAKLIFSLSTGESLDFCLKADQTRLGRHATNEIVIDNTWISSFHAEFRREGNGLSLRDLQSSNGTSVNGKRIGTQVLKQGDRIAFGQLEAVFQDDKVEVAVPPSLAAEVVSCAMAPPAATIGYDTARREAMAELEGLQKKITEATVAAEKAVVERVGAEALLTEMAAVRLLALAEVTKFEQGREAARAEAQQEFRQQEAAKAAAGAALEVQQQEMMELAAEHEQLQSSTAAAVAAAAAAAETARAEWAGLQESLADVHRERAGLSSTLADEQAQLQRCRQDLALVRTELEEARREGRAALEEMEVSRREAAVADSEALKARESLLAETVLVQTSLDLAKLQTTQLTENLEILRAEAEPLRREAAEWPARRAANLTELAELETNLASARYELEQEDQRLSVRRQLLQQMQEQHSDLAGQVNKWMDLSASATRQAATLAADQAAAAVRRGELEESEARRKVADSAAVETRSRHLQLQEEIHKLEARLGLLRRETDGAESLNSKVADLRQQQAEAERRLDIFNDRLAGMSEAPDPNWGTVHSLARSFIKKLDLIDDLMAHLATQPESTATLEQLKVFRDGLLDILKEYSIEPYSLEPGTVIDVAARKRIQIVETLSEGSHDGTRVVRTYRPGYVCLNGDLGIQTLLRKADVAVSIALS